MRKGTGPLEQHTVEALSRIPIQLQRVLNGEIMRRTNCYEVSAEGSAAGAHRSELDVHVRGAQSPPSLWDGTRPCDRRGQCLLLGVSTVRGGGSVGDSAITHLVQEELRWDTALLLLFLTYVLTDTSGTDICHADRPAFAFSERSGSIPTLTNSPTS